MPQVQALLVLSLVLALADSPATAQSQSPAKKPDSISLVDATVTLEPVRDTYEGWALLTGTARYSNVESIDVAIIEIGGEVQVSFPDGVAKPTGGSGDVPTWRVRVRADGLIGGQSVTRYATATVPGTQQSFLLTFNSKAVSKPKLSWEIQPESLSWRPRRHSDVILAASVDGHDLPSIEVAYSSLVRSDHEERLDADRFVLCLVPCPTTASADAIPISGNEITTLYLSLKNAESLVGVYKGKIGFTAGDGSTTKAIELEIARRSDNALRNGLIVAAAGLILAFVVNTLIFRRQARIKARLPASRTVEDIERLEARIREAETAANVKFQVTTAYEAATAVRNRLSVGELDRLGFLPDVWSISSVPETKRYVEYISEQRKALEVIEFVIEQALEPMLNDWDKIPDDARQAAESLLLDAGSQAAKSDMAAINVELIEIRKDFAALWQVGRFFKDSPEAANVPHILREVDFLSVQLLVLSWTVFLIWSAITLVGGWYVLIESNPGFGLFTDYLRAFLWGAGVPVLGVQLQQLTPKVISSSFRVAVPTAKK